jgi:hypothetical protein
MTRRVPFVGGEKESLWAALDRHRNVVLWKLAKMDKLRAGVKEGQLHVMAHQEDCDPAAG